MTAEVTPSTYTCVVCGEVAAPRMSSECNGCNGRFHLNQRNDIEARDCGQVWIDEQYLALQFACNNCLPAEMRVESTAATHPGTPPKAERAPRQRRYRRRD